MAAGARARGELTVGLLAAFLTTEQFFRPVRARSGLYTLDQSALSGAELHLRVLDEPRRARERPTPSPWRAPRDLSFEDVGFAYASDRPVLLG